MADNTDITCTDENIVDIAIPTLENKELNDEASEIFNKLMNNAPWLWRHTKKDNVEKEIIKSSAFHLKETEETISLYELIDKYKAVDKKYIKVEANHFMTFIMSEVLRTSSTSIPVALIKEKLIKEINIEEALSIFKNGIELTTGEKEEYILGMHWDINPPERNSQYENNLHIMYNILAASSECYENLQGPIAKMASQNLDAKRKENL